MNDLKYGLWAVIAIFLFIVAAQVLLYPHEQAMANNPNDLDSGEQSKIYLVIFSKLDFSEQWKISLNFILYRYHLSGNTSTRTPFVSEWIVLVDSLGNGE